MVGRSYSLDTRRVESADLKIALYEMKEDMQRLEEELDAERDASATSASETMSFIQRLQGEKAMLAMEASQYKRMSEERISHAETSLDLLEELNYNKDVEIMNLECELGAYKSKLICLGYRGMHDPFMEDDCMRCCDRSQTPSPEPVDIDFVEKGVIEQSLDSSRRDQEKIKKLDEQLKELMDFKDAYKKSSMVQDIAEKERVEGLLMKKMSKKSSKRKRDKSVKRDDASGSCCANEAEYQAELQRLKERVERLEREKCNIEPKTSEVQQENMNFLRKSEQELMKSGRTTQNLFHGDDSALVAVQEAMLYFWL